MAKKHKYDGKTYGHIEVLKYIGDATYLCRCNLCGKTYNVSTGNVGRKFMCRDCHLKLNRLDLADKKFGRLTARKRTELTKHSSGKDIKITAWICDCECGNTAVVRTELLSKGVTKSCGCIRKDMGMPEEIKDLFVDGTLLSHIKSKPTKSNKTGVVGVNWDKSRNKWQASLRIRGKKINIGRFDDFDAAVKARKDAEIEYFKPTLDKYEKDSSVRKKKKKD